MKVYRNKFLVWLVLTLAGFAVLPLYNTAHEHWRIRWDSATLFNLDRVQGWVNYGLYRVGISGNYPDVIVGKDGWLFLGNTHRDILNKARGASVPATAAAHIETNVRRFLEIQTWLKERGIPMLFVIAPSKYSIYHEYYPVWLEAPARTSTDDFVAEAQVRGLHVLDLRPALRAAKTSSNKPLYYSTDTHWNRYTAALSYLAVMDGLERIHGLHFKAVTNIRYKPVPRMAGDLAHLLKIDWILGGVHDNDFGLEFEGRDDPVCIKLIRSKADVAPGDCPLEKNQAVEVASTNKLVLNRQALNPQSLLWLHDSFGIESSILFHKTFQYTWQGFYVNFLNDTIHLAVNLVHPDVVIYQLTERDILF